MNRLFQDIDTRHDNRSILSRGFIFFFTLVRRQVQTSTGEEERLIIIYRTDISTRVETACETALSINYIADVSRKLS